MNAAAVERARAEAERIGAANSAANAGGPPVVPHVVPAAALPPAAQVVIGADALAQIIVACQPQPHVAGAGAILTERAGSTRLKAFSSTDSVEWMSWKTHYLEVCDINALPNICQVREARAAMAEKAARHMADIVPVYVADLAVNPPVQITTWQDLIARYQEKFMPAAAGVYSRAEYNIAKQILSKDVGGWNACLRDLYNRMYPGKEVYNNLPLIEKFVTQTINKEVGKFASERDPATFAGALALAQTKTATDMTFKTASRATIHAFTNPSSAMADNGVNYSGVNYLGKRHHGGRGGRGNGGCSCPERREQKAGKCWICNSSSHQKSACPVWDNALMLALEGIGRWLRPRPKNGRLLRRKRQESKLPWSLFERPQPLYGRSLHHRSSAQGQSFPCARGR
jgi:hypothetical protein